MLEKLSVKKPFTVLVGVILIIVLGVVSFMGTTTDLLPDMELPVSVVVTTQIGATPEQIERDITIPIEGVMRTLSGINTVSSMSNEHVSIVILQFIDSINMDAASLEIREALDRVNLPEGVERPMTLRLNPDMMPVMSAALSMEGLSIDALSELAMNEFVPALETVPGVATVNLNGTVQNQIHVILRAEHVENVNADLNQALTELMEEMASFSENRILALMAEGLSQEQAIAQVQLEFPAVEASNVATDEQIGLPAEIVSIEAITGLLSAQNFSMPAGMTIEDGIEYMVRVGDTFQHLNDIKNLVVFNPELMGLIGSDPIRLTDVADVFLTDDSALSFSRVNGNPSIMLTIQRQSRASVSDVSAALHDRMDELTDEHAGLDFVVLMDQGEIIGEVIDSMLSNLISGGLLAIVILFLFLKDIRPTFMVAVSIPVSLMLAFTLMYFTGISLNMMSMGGLALAVGMLVDNSIVVIENIYRVRSTTELSPARAAIAGAKQVSGSIFASTLTTIAVFFPVVFTGGLTRQLFQDLALTIAYSLLASLLIALTVIPSASSLLLKNIKAEQEGKWFSKLTDGYEKVLRLALRFKWLVLALSTVAFALSLWLINRQGMELFPASDSSQLTVTAEMPTNTEFDDVVRHAEALADRVLALQDVETVGVSIGGNMMLDMMGIARTRTGGGTNITMYVLLEDGRLATNDAIISHIHNIGDDLGLDVSASADEPGMGMMMGDPISFRVEGDDLDDMRETALALAEIVRSVEGAINVTDLEIEAAQELRVTVDHDAAMSYGLTVAQIFMAVNEALTAPEHTLSLHLEGRNYDIIIKDGDFTLPSSVDLESLQLVTPTGDVTLSDIADVHEGVGFTSISRMNGIRYVTISGDIADGFNVGLVNDDITSRLADFEAVPGTTVVIGGEAQALAEAFDDLILMLVLAVLFIYLIMVAQFQSLLSPFIIMFSIPLAFTGGFLALLISGVPLSIVAMIGLILLAGVIVNNGIVLLDFVNQLRWNGTSKKEALVEAGRQRLRPVLMTALTTIVSMSFVALGVGEGTEMMQPMALVTLGGLIYGDLMVLFVVPALYDLLNNNKDVTKENLDDPDDTLEMNASDDLNTHDHKKQADHQKQNAHHKQNNNNNQAHHQKQSTHKNQNRKQGHNKKKKNKKNAAVKKKMT
ncbi:MAG: efflux RND transporter permease subunit [Defluviitaleaceae bacterium]|nr:efflux RND transporter permease subunit [Defluviitaleaceae bacterium]